MRTRAQTTRDAALRRLTLANRSLAVAALVGTGIVTDVVANTAAGHTTQLVEKTAGTATVKASTSPTAQREPVVHRHRRHHAPKRAVVPPAASTTAATAATSAASSDSSSSSSSEPSSSSSSLQTSSPPSAPAVSTPAVSAPQPTVVAVSGGS